ncbi:MAG: hypothetical protein WKF49_03140 [Thermoleophilaceae bacterium]
MIIEHRGRRPVIDPSAYIASTAVLPGRRCRRLPGGLDFPGAVYGITRDTSPRERMTRQAAWLAAHRDYTVLDSGDC